jgi:hypothetical protein
MLNDSGHLSIPYVCIPCVVGCPFVVVLCAAGSRDAVGGVGGISLTKCTSRSVVCVVCAWISSGSLREYEKIFLEESVSVCESAKQESIIIGIIHIHIHI